MPHSLNRVLVLADGPVVAALIGLLVETTGRNPVFAQPDEVASDALERTRPIAAVIIDASLNAAESDLFFAAAAKWNIGVAVFGPESAARRIAEIAGGRGIPWFTMPPTADQLATALDVAIGTERRRGDHERRLPTSQAVIAPDGTRILHDRNGQRWMVYDRRMAMDRRNALDEPIAVRVFVSEAGESRECGLAEQEVRQASASALELQLARCTRP
ncbi:MAG TPA: hypothetical protein VH277_20440 [Gemmatimonadaceae bacterium]|jgi:hypothetical protein|nr:hypothetical protein [Gemmatimonadaceae bacterium]